MAANPSTELAAFSALSTLDLGDRGREDPAHVLFAARIFQRLEQDAAISGIYNPLSGR